MSLIKTCSNIKCKKKFEAIRKFPNTNIYKPCCSIDCEIALLKQKQDKKKRSDKTKIENNKKLYPSIAKQSKTSYTGRLNYARKIFQAWIRDRDKNEPCISCGTYNAKYYDGGHYFKAEIFPNLIFNLENVNKQCRKCNRYLNGNEAAYTIGLIKKIGIERFQKLQNDASKAAFKYSDEELKSIRDKYKLPKNLD